MKAKDQKHFLLMFILLVLFNNLMGQNDHEFITKKGVTLERTEIRVVHSNIVDQDYVLWVSLPVSYTNGDDYYPLIIVLDPYRSFLIMKAGVDVFSTTPAGLLPEVILVGIGYGGDDSNSLEKFALGRTRDLTPTTDSIAEASMRRIMEASGFANCAIRTGGASKFLEFIRDELFPFIHSNYRVDMNNKALYGYSYGGLFGLYTLFHVPETFNKYLIGSPSIHFSGGITFLYENEYATSNADLNAMVFMSSGSLEKTTMKNMLKMENLLLSRNYPNLKLKTVIFENESHTSCAPAAISRGLIELFKND
jgi:uncharacterized protein